MGVKSKLQLRLNGKTADASHKQLLISSCVLKIEISDFNL